ncbi:hypothetical protein TNCV_3914391 [Trichonephila clavipes]|nr:hypothetical protein TNCV_3914391 [Trichonephila clavipes]
MRRLSIRLWGILFHSSKSAISNRTAAGDLSRSNVVQACPKHARFSGQESTLAIPYAILFQKPEELYEQPIFFGPHGGVGSTECNWPTCIDPHKAERTVWLDILRPVSKIAFSVLFRRAVNCIYRSSVDVVARGRPAPGRRLTLKFHSLATTSGDFNSFRDTTLCLHGFQSAYKRHVDTGKSRC